MNEQEQSKRGQEIADILLLRRDKEYKDRYKTTWGTKTPLGIYKTVERLLREV